MWQCKEDSPICKIDDRGLSALTDSELLSTLLGDSPKAVELAKALLLTFGGLREISRASTVDLKNAGANKKQSAAIAAGFELARRKLSTEHQCKNFTYSGDIARHLIPTYGDLLTEVFIVISLNRKHDVISTKVVHLGGVSHVSADPKVIFKEAISNLASAIVVCHNHPSGNAQPSKADDLVTRDLVQAGELLGIPVLDHIIIARQNWYSYTDHGRIQEIKAQLATQKSSI